MCGIAGIYHRRGASPDRAALDAMTDRLAHRGPDGRGVYVHRGAGLGHRRLSIIGVGDGQQPMSNEDQTIWITFNGEIYNHLALRAELEGLGHTFKTRSDTEVIVHGYEAWGDAVPERLRGIFAFAVHDQVRDRLLLARDHLGVKPLYYALEAETFLFGSEPKAILAHPHFTARPDLESLHLYLRYGYVPAPRSAFLGMAQLEPGSRMLVDASSHRVERYWRPGPIGGRERAADEEVDRRIDEAVGLELMSEVPLGAFLSGGIDSSIVAASMGRALAAPPRTFCIGFPEPDYDESRYSRAIAEHLGLDHSVDMVSVEDLDALGTLAAVYDEPFADASALPTYALCKMARRHVTVALSGDGGDEVFAGYRRYAKLAEYPRVPERMRGLFERAADAWPPMLRGQRKLRQYASSLAMQYELDLSIFPEHVLPEIVEAPLLVEPEWSIARVFESAPAEEPVAKAQWCDLMSYLPNDILVKVDRASMAHALEVRVPLLDHRLLEWAFGLPLTETFGGGEQKLALKKHLARRVPRALFERPKMGFGVPLGYWLGTGLREVAERLAPGGRFRAPIRAGALERLIAASGAWDQSPGVWSLLFLEAWWRRHFG